MQCTSLLETLTFFLLRSALCKEDYCMFFIAQAGETRTFVRSSPSLVCCAAAGASNLLNMRFVPPQLWGHYYVSAIHRFVGQRSLLDVYVVDHTRELVEMQPLLSVSVYQ